MKKGKVVWYTVLDRDLDEVDSSERTAVRDNALAFRLELRADDKADTLDWSTRSPGCHSGPYHIGKLVIDG